MNSEQKPEGIKILRIVLGVAVGVAAMIILNMIFAALILSETLPQENMGLYAAVATVIGSILSGMICSNQGKVLLYGLLCGSANAFVRYFLGMLLYRGNASYGLISGLVISIICTSVGVMLATLLRHKK